MPSKMEGTQPSSLFLHFLAPPDLASAPSREAQIWMGQRPLLLVSTTLSVAWVSRLGSGVDSQATFKPSDEATALAAGYSTNNTAESLSLGTHRICDVNYVP